MIPVAVPDTNITFFLDRVSVYLLAFNIQLVQKKTTSTVIYYLVSVLKRNISDRGPVFYFILILCFFS